MWVRIGVFAQQFNDIRLNLPQFPLTIPPGFTDDSTDSSRQVLLSAESRGPALWRRGLGTARVPNGTAGGLAVQSGCTSAGK